MHDHRPITAGITDGLILPTFHSSQPRPLQPQPQANLECPRCHSLDTKFCYFNNYNLAQPRHFCRSCRRYWTKGGVLRNVPVGGGCRKSSKRRPSSSSSSPSRPAKRSTPHRPPDDNREPSPSAVTPVPASWTVQEAGSIEAGVAGAVALRPPMFGYGSYEPSAPSPGVTDELRLPEELPGMAFADPIGWPGSLDVVVGWHDDAGGARSWTEGDPSRYLP